MQVSLKNGSPAGTAVKDKVEISNDTLLQKEDWSIDPILLSYPTGGPNDAVPIGCNPVPMNYMLPAPEPVPMNYMLPDPELEPPPWAIQMMQRLELMEQRMPTTTLPVRMDPPTVEQSKQINILSFPMAPSITTEASNQAHADSQPINHKTKISNHAPATEISRSIQEEQSTVKPPRMSRNRPSKPTPILTRQQAKQKGVKIPALKDLLTIGKSKNEFNRSTSPAQFNGPKISPKTRENTKQKPYGKDIAMVKHERLEDDFASGMIPSSPQPAYAVLTGTETLQGQMNRTGRDLSSQVRFLNPDH